MSENICHWINVLDKLHNGEISILKQIARCRDD